MNKKKTFAFLSFLLLLSLFLVACGTSTENNGTSNDNSAPSNNTTSNDSDEKIETDFPNKPIEMIVPYAAGGSTDQIARVLQKAIEKHLPNGQTLQIINEPGGAGVIGLTKVLNAKPDGYTIGLTASGALTNQPHYGNATYTHDSFQPVSRVATSPILLAVRADSPWESLDDLIDYLSKNPGEFTYTSSGSGNPAHIAMEKLSKELDTETVNIPADGSGEAFIAMLGGHVDGTTGSSQQFSGHLESEDIRIIANMGSIKGEAYKDVPTLQEKGINAATDIFFGVLAPKGIPEENLDILNNAFKQALRDEELLTQFQAAGIEPHYAGPEDFQKNITESFNSEGDVLKEMGLAK